MIELIDRLINEGAMKKLVDAGLASPKVFIFREIYFEYDKRIRLGDKPLSTVVNIAESFKVSESYVWKAIKLMKPAA